MFSKFFLSSSSSSPILLMVVSYASLSHSYPLHLLSYKDRILLSRCLFRIFNSTLLGTSSSPEFSLILDIIQRNQHHSNLVPLFSSIKEVLLLRENHVFTWWDDVTLQRSRILYFSNRSFISPELVSAFDSDSRRLFDYCLSIYKSNYLNVKGSKFVYLEKTYYSSFSMNTIGDFSQSSFFPRAKSFFLANLDYLSQSKNESYNYRVSLLKDTITSESDQVRAIDFLPLFSLKCQSGRILFLLFSRDFVVYFRSPSYSNEITQLILLLIKQRGSPDKDLHASSEPSSSLFDSLVKPPHTWIFRVLNFWHSKLFNSILPPDSPGYNVLKSRRFDPESSPDDIFPSYMAFFQHLNLDFNEYAVLPIPVIPLPIAHLPFQPRFGFFNSLSFILDNRSLGFLAPYSNDSRFYLNAHLGFFIFMVLPLSHSLLPSRITDLAVENVLELILGLKYPSKVYDPYKKDLVGLIRSPTFNRVGVKRVWESVPEEDVGSEIDPGVDPKDIGIRFIWKDNRLINSYLMALVFRTCWGPLFLWLGGPFLGLGNSPVGFDSHYQEMCKAFPYLSFVKRFSDSAFTSPDYLQPLQETYVLLSRNSEHLNHLRVFDLEEFSSYKTFHNTLDCFKSGLPLFFCPLSNNDAFYSEVRKELNMDQWPNHIVSLENNIEQIWSICRFGDLSFEDHLTSSVHTFFPYSLFPVYSKSSPKFVTFNSKNWVLEDYVHLEGLYNTTGYLYHQRLDEFLTEKRLWGLYNHRYSLFQQYCPVPVISTDVHISEKNRAFQTWLKYSFFKHDLQFRNDYYDLLGLKESLLSKFLFNSKEIELSFFQEVLLDEIVSHFIKLSLKEDNKNSTVHNISPGTQEGPIPNYWELLDHLPSLPDSKPGEKISSIFKTNRISTNYWNNAELLLKPKLYKLFVGILAEFWAFEKLVWELRKWFKSYSVPLSVKDSEDETASKGDKIKFKGNKRGLKDLRTLNIYKALVFRLIRDYNVDYRDFKIRGKNMNIIFVIRIKEESPIKGRHQVYMGIDKVPDLGEESFENIPINKSDLMEKHPEIFSLFLKTIIIPNKKFSTLSKFNFQPIPITIKHDFWFGLKSPLKTLNMETNIWLDSGIFRKSPWWRKWVESEYPDLQERFEKETNTKFWVTTSCFNYSSYQDKYGYNFSEYDINDLDANSLVGSFNNPDIEDKDMLHPYAGLLSSIRDNKPIIPVELKGKGLLILTEEGKKYLRVNKMTIFYKLIRMISALKNSPEVVEKEGAHIQIWIHEYVDLSDSSDYSKGIKFKPLLFPGDCFDSNGVVPLEAITPQLIVSWEKALSDWLVIGIEWQIMWWVDSKEIKQTPVYLISQKDFLIYLGFPNLSNSKYEESEYMKRINLHLLKPEERGVKTPTELDNQFVREIHEGPLDLTILAQYKDFLHRYRHKYLPINKVPFDKYCKKLHLLDLSRSVTSVDIIRARIAFSTGPSSSYLEAPYEHILGPAYEKEAGEVFLNEYEILNLKSKRGRFNAEQLMGADSPKDSFSEDLSFLDSLSSDPDNLSTSKESSEDKGIDPDSSKDSED